MGGAVTEGSRVYEAVARRDAVLPRVGQLGMDESGAAGHAAQAWEAAVAPCMPIVATGNKLVASRNKLVATRNKTACRRRVAHTSIATTHSTLAARQRSIAATQRHARPADPALSQAWEAAVPAYSDRCCATCRGG